MGCLNCTALSERIAKLERMEQHWYEVSQEVIEENERLREALTGLMANPDSFVAIGKAHEALRSRQIPAVRQGSHSPRCRNMGVQGFQCADDCGVTPWKPIEIETTAQVREETQCSFHGAKYHTPDVCPYCNPDRKEATQATKRACACGAWGWDEHTATCKALERSSR